ncbi:MFS transporter [Corynebacterium lowii]|uniref:Putative proline/betaine transporter n=1 Tax=Corynebacterium lowii TaxID=1544413 RepID=A0A0Q0YGP9_9CORY|nr:MFS transporter [Corynebacterium lowii]KQB85785.1 Alpha-ketoglutarate permease [Corynebacterium lowii]MDP9851087.1 MHS family alpha-ketoglutarate permease-like MFS transporter [Corynebacterium lowii]
MSTPTPQRASTLSTTRTIIAASSGNLVEWFDFYIYAFFSVYFADKFFTGTGETGALLKSAAVFFVGFLMRPLGGYIFGRIADRHGRKKSMLIAIVMMCSGSLMMALLPTAETVGALAPVLLLIVRCIQGISVGGEYGSTATYMSEVADPHRRGFFSSFHYVTLIGGQLLASLLAVVMTFFLTDEEIANGWWRLPFVIGACAAIVALWLRSHLHETAPKESREESSAGTFREVLAHPRAFWVVMGLTAAGSLAFYTFTTYMQKYLINTGGFAKGDVATVMTACLLLFMLLQPAIGALSDRIGRKNSMLIFSAGMVILPVPLFAFLGAQDSLWVSAGAIVLAMFFLTFYTSISGIVKAEMFPAHIRGLGVGFTYAIANSLFGGSAESVALGLKNIGVAWLFPWYVVAVALLGLVAVLFMRDNRQHSTIDFPEAGAADTAGAAERPA